MRIKEINGEKCIKCEECVKDCPAGLFISPPTPAGEKKKILYEDPNDRCIRCGHCVSICPVDAIIYEGVEETLEFEEAKNPSSLISYDKLMKVLRSRRSIRRYKEDPVPKEDIKKVLNAIRYAPSARNAQLWRFLVITNPEEIEIIRNAVIKMMKLLESITKKAKIIKYFVPKRIRDIIEDPATLAGLNKFFEHVDKGEDPVFYGAPVVIITYTPEYGDMSGNDVGIALTYGMLAAQSLGLGSCWIGYAQEALSRSKKIRKHFKISKRMNVKGVLILGIPSVKYYRVPPREKLKVRWI
ncbi:MAG: nitroreductase family protein [Promethearchaeota archaeon]